LLLFLRPFQQGIHILTEGFVFLFLPLYFPKFRLQGGLLGGESVQFRFQLSVGIDLLSQQGKVGVLLGLGVILNINEQADFTVMPRPLSGGAGVSGDPGGDGTLCISHARGFRTGEAFLIGRTTGDVFSRLTS
jgi:hypothetical protein